MIVGVITETLAKESRVAISPTSVKLILSLGYTVQLQSGCGNRAFFSDADYEQVGAKVLTSASEVLATSDVVLKVTPPTEREIEMVRPGTAWIGYLWPARNQPLMEKLRDKKVSAIAMDCIPRISRAQKMDALSSMTNIAGYRAIIEAANVFSGFFAGQITAAGKVPPAKVLVIGAGVAGLAAIGAARGLGAIVRAFDTRAAVKEQVQSMGAEFLELDFKEDGDGAGGYAKEMSPAFIAAEMALFASQAKECDIIVTTAIIPNKPAPKLITREMVESMKPGSVIVDMAAEQGGNCECTVPGEMAEHHGVRIIGYTDLVSRMASRASSMYANNLANLLTVLTPQKDGQIQFDLQDDIVRGSLVTHQGELRWPLPRIETSVQTPSAKAKEQSIPLAQAETKFQWAQSVSTLVGGTLWSR